MNNSERKFYFLTWIILFLLTITNVKAIAAESPPSGQLVEYVVALLRNIKNNTVEENAMLIGQGASDTPICQKTEDVDLSKPCNFVSDIHAKFDLKSLTGSSSGYINVIVIDPFTKRPIVGRRYPIKTTLNLRTLPDKGYGIFQGTIAMTEKDKLPISGFIYKPMPNKHYQDNTPVEMDMFGNPLAKLVIKMGENE